MVHLAQLQPGHVDDLLRVASEVGHAVEERLQAGDVHSLDTPDAQQFFGPLLPQHSPCLRNDGFESAQQFGPRNRPLRGELGEPVADVLAACESAGIRNVRLPVRPRDDTGAGGSAVHLSP